MAILSQSPNTWIFSLKIVFISTLVLTTALVLNFSVPLLRDFCISVVPHVWNSLLSWLTPPYLYFVINGIIICIAASSQFHHSGDDAAEPVAEKNTAEIRPDFEVPVQFQAAAALKSRKEIRSEFEVSEALETTDAESGITALESSSGGEAEEFVISRSDWMPKWKDWTECSISTEKPLVSTRFGHKKNVKASPDGSRALGVAKSKRNETLESTWKTITEGRAMPLARHLRKSDMWETTHGGVRSDELDGESPAMKKSETMRERISSSSPSPSPASGKLLRKESSLSQDDLNRRVEAFIKKFNEEMRLQRQESLKHYREMINRGSL